MITVIGRVRSVDINNGKSSAIIETGPNQTTTVFIEPYDESGDAGQDAIIAKAKKTTLATAAAWGLPVEIDANAHMSVNYIIFVKV